MQSQGEWRRISPWRILIVLVDTTNLFCSANLGLEHVVFTSQYLRQFIVEWNLLYVQCTDTVQIQYQSSCSTLQHCRLGKTRGPYITFYTGNFLFCPPAAYTIQVCLASWYVLCSLYTRQVLTTWRRTYHATLFAWSSRVFVFYLVSLHASYCRDDVLWCPWGECCSYLFLPVGQDFCL